VTEETRSDPAYAQRAAAFAAKVKNSPNCSPS
jgi:hypothetical protein